MPEQRKRARPRKIRWEDSTKGWSLAAIGRRQKTLWRRIVHETANPRREDG